MQKSNSDSKKNSNDFQPIDLKELANAKPISQLLAEGKLGNGSLAKHVQYQLEGKCYYDTEDGDLF